MTPHLVDVVQCPDCRGSLVATDGGARCTGCARVFSDAAGYLDLRPSEVFDEQTKYLDEALHADARHESISPPLLGSRVRNTMLRRFLSLGPGDRVIDLGCGSGRALAWNADTGATLTGVDISPYFAHDAIGRSGLVLGDLRRLPLKDAAFTKAWTLDVLEHLSPAALRDVLTEANRVLAPGGALFIYTHVRKNGWIALGLRGVNRLARGLEHVDLIDLRQERLRKSDHLNPIASHEELEQVLGACGFRLERRTYYTPIIGALVENVLVRLGERWLTRRAARRSDRTGDELEAVRNVRTAAKARIARRGPTYVVLRGLSALMMLDVWLFGRLRSGPFFALARRVRT